MVQSSTKYGGLGLLVALAVGCGGGGSAAITAPTAPSTATSPTGSPTTPATSTVVTVSATGLSPQVITVSVGTRVTFTNIDTRPHDFSGGPDPSRPECPEIDAAGFVVPGQSKQTGVFATARTCQYHDHAYLGVPAFTGRIVIE
jgi:plastocyanin